MNRIPKNASKKTERPIVTVSNVFDDGSILEMVHQVETKQTGFAIWKDEAWTIERTFTLIPHHRLVPYSPQNNLIKNNVVLLPSEPEDYGLGSATSRGHSRVHPPLRGCHSAL